MVNADQSHALRRAIVTRLKATPEVVALVPAARIYPEQPPARPEWPFIRYGVPIVTPFRAQGWRGAFYELTIHAFAKDDDAGGIYAISQAIVAALDESDGGLPIEGPSGVMTLEWSQTIPLRDTEEASAYHAVVQFNASTGEIVD